MTEHGPANFGTIKLGSRGSCVDMAGSVAASSEVENPIANRRYQARVGLDRGDLPERSGDAVALAVSRLEAREAVDHDA